MKTLTVYRPREFNFLDNALSGFDRYLDSFFTSDFLTPSDRIFNKAPSVDVRETENAYLLEAELPGYDEKDIEIRLDARKLTIETRKEENTQEKPKEEAKTEGTYLVRERRISSFSRSFTLPENADSEGIAASFKNGILSMEIKKKAEAQPKLIQINK